jgi:hypothetical protein
MMQLRNEFNIPKFEKLSNRRAELGQAEAELGFDAFECWDGQSVTTHVVGVVWKMFIWVRLNVRSFGFSAEDKKFGYVRDGGDEKGTNLPPKST